MRFSWKAPSMNQQREAASQSFPEMSGRNCATQNSMENDCRNWHRNRCAGSFREHLAFGARPGPTGLQFWLDCSLRMENVEKHFLSMSNSFPAHIPRQDPLNRINSQRQSSSRSYGYILPTAFTDLVFWTIGVQPWTSSGYGYAQHRHWCFPG